MVAERKRQKKKQPRKVSDVSLVYLLNFGTGLRYKVSNLKHVVYINLSEHKTVVNVYIICNCLRPFAEAVTMTFLYYTT